MKTILFITSFFLLVFSSNINTDLKIPSENISETATMDITLLKDNWKIDLSPENDSDDHFAKMIITDVGDNSGIYNTSFYYKNVLLYGTTHSIDKDFLAVWIATKETK